MIERVLTIGAYGFDEPGFVRALREAGADALVDVRARRGVRGAAYAFANAARLCALLEAAGIRYAHARELAPSDPVRRAQWAADAAAGVKKRERTRLGPGFAPAYERECLDAFSPAAFAATHARGARRPVLFCVEREPEACHRSLVARRLGEALGVPVEHLRPPAGAT